MKSYKVKLVSQTNAIVLIMVLLVTTIAGVIIGCNSHTNGTKSTYDSKDTAWIINKLPEPVDTPQSFVRNYGASDNNKLFAFVGQKIWVQPLPSRSYSFDNGFKAQYLILEKVSGTFPGDTIEFVAYDHYGIPPFSEYKNVLLYVSADSGTYYQQKYMYNDVYKTKDGRWAGPYAWNDYHHEYNKRTRIKPIKIDFEQPVPFPLKIVTDQGHTLTRRFPKPYFKTIGDTAFAVYGNYVNELFILKRDGFLTAREIFRNGKLTP